MTNTLVILALVAVVIFVVALFIGGGSKETSQFERDAIEVRLQPIGQVRVAGASTAEEAPAEVVAAAPKSGEEVYNLACVACHGAGIAGAPKYADAGQWEARIAQGKDTLYVHAIDGFQGASGVMPAKGGNTSLSDDEVKAAVDYMIVAITGEEVAAPAASEEPVAEPAAIEEATPSEAAAESAVEEPAAAEATLDLAKGEEVYKTACVVCHGMGIAGAPKSGSKEHWQPRIDKGMEALYSNAINGYQGESGVMPAKGGNTALSDDDVKAAVAYMVSIVE